MATIEFWYEFASSYSYPTAMRIEEVAERHGVKIVWKPFLLGPIFKAQGWANSPFNMYPEKGEYMWRDVERICQSQGLAFKRLTIFPQNSVLAARLALCPAVGTQMIGFSKQVYQAEFGENQDISKPETLAVILNALDIDAQLAFAQAESLDVKAALRSNTQSAIENKVFGAPFFVTSDGERFWGNDRLEQAVAWQAG